MLYKDLIIVLHSLDEETKIVIFQILFIIGEIANFFYIRNINKQLH